LQEMQPSLTEVDTGPLLHHLKCHTEHDATKIAVGRTPATRKAAEPPTLHVLGLMLEVGLKLGKLILDIIGAGRLTTQDAQ